MRVQIVDENGFRKNLGIDELKTALGLSSPPVIIGNGDTKLKTIECFWNENNDENKDTVIRPYVRDELVFDSLKMLSGVLVNRTFFMIAEFKQIPEDSYHEGKIVFGLPDVIIPEIRYGGFRDAVLGTALFKLGKRNFTAKGIARLTRAFNDRPAIEVLFEDFDNTSNWFEEYPSLNPMFMSRDEKLGVPVRSHYWQNDTGERNGATLTVSITLP